MDCRRRHRHQLVYQVQRAQLITHNLVIIVYRINSKTIAKVNVSSILNEDDQELKSQLIIYFYSTISRHLFCAI